MTFKELTLIEPILKALDEKGYTTPTPIQEQAIVPALQNRDILGLAQTGTGKTAAFALPIIQQLYLNKYGKRREIKALILTPTRELAIQIDDSLRVYNLHRSRHCVIYGGVKQHAPGWRTQAGCRYPCRHTGAIARPHQSTLHQPSVHSTLCVRRSRQNADMGFIHDISDCCPTSTREANTFFSATMPNSLHPFRTIPRNPVGLRLPRLFCGRHHRTIYLLREKQEERFAHRPSEER